MKKAIQEILVGNNLTRQRSCDVMDQVMRGEVTNAQLAALLVGMKMKGETADEIAGFVDSMRSHSLKVLIDDSNAVDGCGTGGDGSHTFNISTAAALVAAAGGATVAKHGNRSVSSKCGSADLLEATGGKIDSVPEVVTDTINQIRFGFMFAPVFHPAMKHAVPVRRELGVRTAFNILGPMTNPAGVKRQVIGVYDDSLMDLMAEVLRATGSEHVIVVRSQDGLDEFSVAAPSEFRELRNGTIEKHLIAPVDVGLSTHAPESLQGGDAVENLAILNKLFDGEKSACRDAVVFNAGALLYVAGISQTIENGARRAERAIDDGSAGKILKDWVELSNRET